MCLKTSYRGRSNPKTDIHVYKVLIHLNGKILAPFTRFEYKLDEILVDTAEENTKKDHAAKVISSGYFHACTTFNRAREIVSGLGKLKKGEVFIYKAIVPCKTKYYTDNGGNICAKSIKVLSEVCV